MSVQVFNSVISIIRTNCSGKCFPSSLVDVCTYVMGKMYYNLKDEYSYSVCDFQTEWKLNKKPQIPGDDVSSLLLQVYVLVCKYAQVELDKENWKAK